MKNYIISFCLLFICMMGVNAQVPKEGQISVRDLEVRNESDSLHISMTIDVHTLKLRSDHEIKLSPALIAGEKSVSLPELTFMGRNRYIRYLRKEEPTSGYVYRLDMVPIVQYKIALPLEAWMRSSELVMLDNLCGCSDKVLMENKDLLSKIDLVPKRFRPVFVYRIPVMEEKHRSARGSAFIDYPVNKSEIVIGYHKNESELQKIYNTIDSVKEDPDIKINSIYIKGFASPEGSFSNNSRLAQERTESLKKHVQHLYSFDRSIIRTDFEAEDWEGLRAYVKSSGLLHKNEILAIIDNDMDPDKKEWKIRATYPNEYKQLLRNCYPSLRHSDYVVNYTVRSYTDVEEAKRVMRERPGNLSLHEFYLVAESYKPGSEDYKATFNLMVRIYPYDETANLNAANVAMAYGDFELAEQFLKKSGNNAEADYARGVCLALKGNYKSAKVYLMQAKDAGSQMAVKALKQIERLEK